MAQKVTPYVEDDLTGEALMDEPGETIRYMFDGMHLEIDLSEANAKAFRDAVAPFVAKSRKVKRSKNKKHDTSIVKRETNQAIRDAARAAGVEVSPHGRIPNDVKAKFSHA